MKKLLALSADDRPGARGRAGAQTLHRRFQAIAGRDPRQPYDEGANADAAVAAAFARAQKSHKRVLIDLGGNWCVDCIVLANFLQLPEMQRFMAAHYEVVTVDVGRFNRNLQIPARFGIHQAARRRARRC